MSYGWSDADHERIEAESDKIFVQLGGVLKRKPSWRRRTVVDALGRTNHAFGTEIVTFDARDKKQYLQVKDGLNITEEDLTEALAELQEGFAKMTTIALTYDNVKYACERVQRGFEILKLKITFDIKVPRKSPASTIVA